MKIGYIGLGKMGYNMVCRLLNFGYDVVAFDKDEASVHKAAKKGAYGATSIEDLVAKMESPRIFWLMVTHDAVEPVLSVLDLFLQPGDVVIDGGNSNYKDSMLRAKKYELKGIAFLDVGVSGGPEGALHGTSVMIGGKKEAYEVLEPLFKDLSVKDGYAYMGKSGAGHFVKMVHNGIEYGMMQSIAEGFDILKNSEFNLNLSDVMNPYRHGSVIVSRLLDWLSAAFEKYSTDLTLVSGTAANSGEGAWTVETGKELGVKVSVLEEALSARIYSEKHPNYQAKIISAMRGEFGKHSVLENTPNANI